MRQTLTINKLIESYLRRNRRLKWATRYLTQRACTLLVDAVGDMEIEDFTLADAEDFQGYLCDRVAKTSANSYIKTVRPCFSWAVRHEMIESNPFDRLQMLRTTPQEIRTYTDSEIAAIFSRATTLWQARIMAALHSGLRRSEVLNLTLDDIHFDQQYIRVRAKKQTALTWHWEPKSYEMRTVPLSPQLSNLLVSTIIPSLPAGQPYPMLTENRYATLRKRIGSIPERIKVTPDENWRPFRNLMIRAGISNGSFHDLRRTAITRWSQCLPYQEVMKLAGHGDIETTLKYYSAVRADVLTLASKAFASIGATGLEPATS